MIRLSCDDVEERLSSLGLSGSFSRDERQRLSTMSIVVPADYYAFPTPQALQAELSIHSLRSLVGTDPRKLPSFHDHPWYLEENFAREGCPAGWHVLRMAPQAESIQQPLNYPHSLPALPRASEVVLMLFLHYLGTGEQLLLRKHTWCRDKADNGQLVTVGAFGRNGVFVSRHDPSYESRGLGVCDLLTQRGFSD
jgi:hypothetical protein